MAAGANPVAVDTALLALLGIPPAHCPLWRAARQAGISGTALEELAFPLAGPAELRVHDFIVPAELGPIRFNPVRFVRSSLQRLLLRVRGG